MLTKQSEVMESADIQNVIDNIGELRDTLDFYSGMHENPEVNAYLEEYAIRSKTIQSFLQNILNKEH